MKRKAGGDNRAGVSVDIDNEETRQIKLDWTDQGTYDACNELVLPSKKRKTVVHRTGDSRKDRKLSRKARRLLEKAAERKVKRSNRSELLKQLQAVQLKENDLQQFASIVTVQTKGVRNYLNEGCRKKLIQKSEEKIDDDAVSIIEKAVPCYDDVVVTQEVTSSSDDEDEKETVDIVDSRSDGKSDVESPGEKPTTEPVQNVAGEAKDQVSEAVSVSSAKLNVEKKPAVFVPVDRSADVIKQRHKLPILAEEQRIMETVTEHPVVFICGETGCGKTTQIPQFLYEAGYTLNGKKVVVTQPRRVAAINMAARVAFELNLSEEEISHVVRFDSTVSPTSRIIFMTDGVLLREIRSDFLLTNYSAVVLDEVHERSVHTDLLLGFLSRIVPLRIKKQLPPLKLIIMSATLQVQHFVTHPRLFVRLAGPPPVIKVDARQFPITVHFNRRTPAPDAYVAEALHKVRKIHALLPMGDILVFVSSRTEVNLLVRQLRGEEGHKISPAIDVLPLYAILPHAEQQLVFRKRNAGDPRLCVVATNVAETSITIPTIRYVVDTGKLKRKVYDKVTGASHYEVDWCSQAAAQQRAGRAGRTGPGHCCRLYSSAVFQFDMVEHEPPEIQAAPIEQLYLQMRCMCIDRVEGFPFVDAPDPLQLKAAHQQLCMLNALDKADKVTSVGRAMSEIAAQPRFAKMLVLSRQIEGLTAYVAALVGALSVTELLQQQRSGKLPPHSGYKGDLGDYMVLLQTVGSSDFANDLNTFCTRHGVREAAIREIRKLRRQLVRETALNEDHAAASLKLAPPSELQCKHLLQILLSGLGDQIAIREKVYTDAKSANGITTDVVNSSSSSSSASSRYAYMTDQHPDEPVFLHPESVWRRRGLARTALPEIVMYGALFTGEKRTYMRWVAAVEPEWLIRFVPNLCHFSQLKFPEPEYDKVSGRVRCWVNATYRSWPLPGGPHAVDLTSVPGTQMENTQWLLKFFLDGVLFPPMAELAPSLLSPSIVIVRSWSRLQQRCDGLLRAALQARCTERSSFVKMWEEQPHFMLAEYLQWLPHELAATATEMWPPIAQDSD